MLACADPHKQHWTVKEASAEREREKVARMKAEAAKEAARAAHLAALQAQQAQAVAAVEALRSQTEASGANGQPAEMSFALLTLPAQDGSAVDLDDPPQPSAAKRR